MKTCQLSQTAILVLLSTAAFAQSDAPARPLARGDVSASIGWFNASARRLDPAPYDDWYGRSLYGGVAAGWYWTDHLKTEIDASATTADTIYGFPPVGVDGLPVNTSVEYSIGTRKVGISQLYQGFRNQWVHPYAGLGVEATWERVVQRHGPTYIYDPVARTSRQVLPGRTLGPDTDVVVRAVGSLGLKAYLTPRSFFRTDLRVAFRGGLDEALVRCGFGVDF
jgi:hypothetical protein